jgi:site-specific recombinase XerD
VLQPDTALGTRVLQNGMRLEDHRPQCISFSGFIPQWRVYANTSFMKNTIRLYNSALKNFIRIIGDKPLNEYRAMDLEHYKSIRLKEVSPTKTNIDFASIKAFFNMAVKWDLLNKNPVQA